MDQDLELLDFYRDEIRFESGMLSSRLNAFGLVFPPSLALLGLVLALHA